MSAQEYDPSRDPDLLKKERDDALKALASAEQRAGEAERENAQLLVRCNELETQMEELSLAHAKEKGNKGK